MKKKEKKEKGKSSGKGLNKKLLIVPAVLLVAGAVGVFLLLGRGTERRVGPLPSDSSVPSGSQSQTGEASSGGESSAQAGDSSGEEPEKEPAHSKTVLESVDYVRSLSPGALGLEGESMEAYEIIPEGGMVLVDGRECTQVRVYRVDEKTGTNQIIGSYLLDRGASGQLYFLDEESGEVTQVDLSGAVKG